MQSGTLSGKYVNARSAMRETFENKRKIRRNSVAYVDHKLLSPA